MPLISLNTLEVGQTILFKSISQYDNITRKALIVGIGNYDLAKQYADLLPYYSDVSKTYPDMAPIEKLNYLILKIYENDNLNNFAVFAKEWLEPSSVQILRLNSYIDIRVYDHNSSDAQNIIDVLNDHGYICKLVTS